MLGKLRLRQKNGFLIKKKRVCRSCNLPAQNSFKGSLKQFLANESPVKMIRNVFCFTLKALFVLKLFQFLSKLFGYAEKRLD